MAVSTAKSTALPILLNFLALVPLMLLTWDYFHNNLTANPIRQITLRTGKIALTFLILSLAVTPVSAIIDYPPLRRLRRPMGLYTFLYAALHFLTFVGLDYGFDWRLIREALFEKRFALVGLAAFLLMVPLAITSTKGWMRRLGARRWQRLHQLVYLAALLVILHYVWLVKADIRVPMIYGAIVVVLLLLRAPFVRDRVNHLKFLITGRDNRHSEETASPQ